MMGAQATAVKQQIALSSCCTGTNTTPAQTDVDTELAYQYRQADDEYTPVLETIDEEHKIEQIIEISPEFNEWIKQNELEDIKHIFIKHEMTQMPISNQTESYRNFFGDKELRMNAYSMQKAEAAIAALNNTKHERNSTDELYFNDIDPMMHESRRDSVELLLRANSVKLCSDKHFSEFADKNSDHIMNKIWQNHLDKTKRGYIETVGEIANAIGFMAVLHTRKKYKKKNKIAPSNQYINKEAHLIAEWVCKSYGELIDDNTYKYRVTKNDLVSGLPKWIKEYGESQGNT